MAEGHDFAVYKDVMIVLGTAAVAVPVLQRLKVSPVLAYLLAGAALGPHGLGALSASIPAFGWVSVAGTENLSAIGELGVVFLLFLIGLELSLQRLVTMRRLVFGLGGLQVLVSTMVIAAAAALLGLDPATATVMGLALALSSTAIIVELLSQQQRLPTAVGRASFAVLLLQDLAVVPLMLLVSIMGPGREGTLFELVLTAFGQAALAVSLIVAVGYLVFRPLFRLVAGDRDTNVFVSATLLVAVASGLMSAAAGLSMTLGAFLAGLLLAETEFRRAIETAIDPFKGVLLGVFFFTIGMSLDIGAIVEKPLPILGTVFGLILSKVVIAGLLTRAFGFSWPVAVESGLLLGACGEFAFIVADQARHYSVLSPESASFVQAVTAASMLLIPLLDVAGRRLSGRLARQEPVDAALLALPEEEAEPRAIVVGYGRVGELVSDMLSRHKVEHVVTELNPKLVGEARRLGRPVYFGDGKNPDFLRRCGLRTAKAVIITIHTWPEVDGLVRAVRSESPTIVIVARARDAEHARHLYEIGVNDAVPETIEASLQLSEAALVGLGEPTGFVIASIHEKRDEFRADLQSAVARSEHGLGRGLRGKLKGQSGPS